MSKSKGRLKLRQYQITKVRKADEEHKLMIGGNTTNTTLYPRCTRSLTQVGKASLADLAALRKQLGGYLDSDRDGRKAGAVPTECRCASCSERSATR